MSPTPTLQTPTCIFRFVTLLLLLPILLPLHLLPFIFRSFHLPLYFPHLVFPTLHRLLHIFCFTSSTFYLLLCTFPALHLSVFDLPIPSPILLVLLLFISQSPFPSLNLCFHSLSSYPTLQLRFSLSNSVSHSSSLVSTLHLQSYTSRLLF